MKPGRANGNHGGTDRILGSLGASGALKVVCAPSVHDATADCADARRDGVPGTRSHDAAPCRSGRAEPDAGRHLPCLGRAVARGRRGGQRHRGPHVRRVRGGGQRARRRPAPKRRRQGRQGRGPGQVGHDRPVRRDHGRARLGGRLRPGRRGRPRRARSTRVRRVRRRCRGGQRTGDLRAAVGRARGGRATGTTGRALGRRLGHLHLRLHRDPEGRGGDAPLGGGVRGRGVAAVPAAAADRRARPGDGGSVRRVRRVVRGDVAGLGPRSVPRPGSAVPGAQRRRRRAVAGGERRDHRVDGPDAGLALAVGVAGQGAAADHGRRGVPAGDR